MEKLCKTCGKSFEPNYAREINCAPCREVAKARKQKSRAGQEAAREAKRIPPSHEYDIPRSQRNALNESCLAYITQICLELGLDSLTSGDDDVVSACALTVVGFEKNVIKRVCDPSGVLVGGGFPDSRVHSVVQHVHLHPALMRSPVFQELYRKFLEASKKLAQAYEGLFEPRYADLLNQELDGTYGKKLAAQPSVATPQGSDK